MLSLFSDADALTTVEGKLMLMVKISTWPELLIYEISMDIDLISLGLIEYEYPLLFL